MHSQWHLLASTCSQQAVQHASRRRRKYVSTGHTPPRHAFASAADACATGARARRLCRQRARGRTARAGLNTCTEWGAHGTRGVAESNLGHEHDLDMLVDGNRDITLGRGVAQVCWQRRAGPPLKRVAVAERRRSFAPVGHKHWRCLQAQPVRLFRRECACACACACAVCASVRRERACNAHGGVHAGHVQTKHKTGLGSTASSGEARQGRRCCDPAAPTAPAVRLDLCCRPTCAHACGQQGEPPAG